MNNNINTPILVSVPFNELEKKNSEAVNRLFEQLERTGWCLIKLEENDQKLYQNFSSNVEKFFNEEENEKIIYSQKNNLGYVKNVFKDGFKWLSGDKIRELQLPKHIPKQDLSEISLKFDNFFLSLLHNNLFTIFKEFNQDMPKADKLTLGKLGRMRNIPLAIDHENSKTSYNAKDHGYGYGMLDLVKYTTNPVNRQNLVEPHLDGGLFSISFYSNAQGLEMLDLETNHWVPVPLDMGVFWCGVEAIKVTKNRYKGGYHRVKPHVDYPRISMWYEVCIYNQIVPLFGFFGLEIQKDDLPEEDKFTLTFKLWSNEVLYMKVHPKTTIGEIKSELENETGVSMSKTVIYTELVKENEPLNNSLTVEEYGIKLGDVIDMRQRKEEPNFSLDFN